MKFLFTIAFADGFHGSVVHVYELARYFISKGHNCTVATISYEQNIKSMYNQAGIDMVLLDQVDTKREYDVLFGIHFPTVSYLLKHRIIIKKLVLNCLSRIELLEMFPAYYSAAGMLLTCSEKVRNDMHTMYNIPLEDIEALENLIPDEFAAYSRIHSQSPEHPSRIAVVSNHIPEEVMELKDIMPDSEITFFGVQTGNYKKITPELLDSFDVVISIGKTIQYAMGLGIPAYEYDRFGGNGYITTDNMDTEAWFNFAGRNTCRKLTSRQIKDELLTQYKSCVEQQSQLKEMALQRFLMSSRLDRLLEDIEEMPVFDYAALNKCKYNPDIDLNTGEMFCFFVKNNKNTIKNREDHIARLEQRCEKLEQSNRILAEHNANLVNTVENMKNSTSWKITAWLRKLMSFLK